MQRKGKIWWKSGHSTYLQSKPLEKVTWLEFKDVFDAQYFSSIVQSNKFQFMILEQKDLTIAVYKVIFLIYKRFMPGSLVDERGGVREVCGWFEIESSVTCGIIHMCHLLRRP